MQADAKRTGNDRENKKRRQQKKGKLMTWMLLCTNSLKKDELRHRIIKTAQEFIHVSEFPILERQFFRTFSHSH